MAFTTGRRLRPTPTPLAGLILATVLLSGCAAAPSRPELTGPAAPVTPTYQPWAYGGHLGVLMHTAHYDIYTTVTDPAVRQRLPIVMEGALGEYHRLAPGVPLDGPPMKCFVFGSREQWVDFTRRNTGPESYWYLKINRGGYTIPDLYVAYNVGEAETLSVAAHEGWHLFAFQHFKGRLPPFLDEGIATMFEDLRWTPADAAAGGDLPRWNLLVNRTRVDALQRSVSGGHVFALADLVRMHAGNVVAQNGAEIEAFYAESWAFATFLWAADGGRYRPALRRLIDDTAGGVVYDPTGVLDNAALPWNPAAVRPMLEHYLGRSLEAVDADYQRYIRKVAFEEYNQQWN